jgi:hypothetical protein
MENFKNFAKATVSTGYDSSATTIALSAGHGTKLPNAPFNAVWWNSSSYPDPSDDPNVEVVRVTAISTDTLTITRAQEGTSASTKNTGSTYKIIAPLTSRIANATLLKPNVRRWRGAQAAIGSSNQITTFGITHIAGGTVTSSASTATEPWMANYATAATTSSTAGFGTNGNPVIRTGRNVYFSALVKLQESTQMRVWIGLTDRAFSTIMGNDTIGGSGSAAFRFSTIAGDTNWQCWTNDGVTTGLTDTGIAFNTDIHLFEIIMDDVLAEVRFYIDGVLAATRTGASIPPSGLNLFPTIGVLTNENVAKNIRIAYVHIEDDL